MVLNMYVYLISLYLNVLQAYEYIYVSNIKNIKHYVLGKYEKNSYKTITNID